jgi:transcriptional regulator with XRE-family HTH domain
LSALASPTLLRWYIAGELRALRERLAMTQAQVAQRISRDRSYIAQLERGRNLPSAADFEVMLGYFDLPPSRIRTMLQLLDAAAHGEDWFAPFEGAAPAWFNLLLAAERVADDITTYAAGVVPGLAQTRRYSEAVIRDLEPDLSDDEVSWRVDLRATRQQILDRRTPPNVRWLVEEAALRHHRFGDDIMREQRARLAELAGRRHVTLQIIPVAEGPHSGVNGGFTLLDLPDLPLAPSIAYADGYFQGTYYDKGDEVKHLRSIVTALIGDVAASPDASSDLLSEMNQ